MAAGDLDGDGLANDICLVDPRTDQVRIEPAPTTGDRYPSFDLRPARYDASKMAPMGRLIGDVNEDGLLDIVVYYWGLRLVAFLRASGTPGHKSRLAADDFQSVELVPGEERWYSNAAVFADVDGDGHPESPSLEIIFRMAATFLMQRPLALRSCTTPSLAPLMAAASTSCCGRKGAAAITPSRVMKK